MQRDTVEYLKRCDLCQKHSLNIHQLKGNLNSISCPWPFNQWGLDIVAMDYFTKLIKAEALANIRDVDAKKFIWKNIINIFKVPKTLIQTMDYNSTIRLSRRTATI